MGWGLGGASLTWALLAWVTGAEQPQELSSSSGKTLNLSRLEVLPGGGWDNLRNLDMGRVINLGYSQCKTTEDGSYLIPDEIFTIPRKQSNLDTNSEIIESWKDYQSITSASINLELSLFSSINGKFSNDFHRTKTHQVRDKAVTTRVQVRNLVYTAKIDPEAALDRAFKKQLLTIASHLENNQTQMADFLAEVLVLNYGTHTITSVDAGATLVQEDQIKATFLKDSWATRSSVTASAGVAFHSIVNVGTKESLAVSSGFTKQVPTVPVKNLTGSSPVNPALAGITGILMSAAGLPVCLTRPPKLVLHPPPVSKSEIQSIPGISHSCRKTTKKQAKKGKTPEEVLKKYLQKVRHPPDEDCTICMERLSAPSGYKGPQPAIKPDLVGKLVKCSHVFHLHCLVAMYNNGNKDGSLQCPTCKTIYGVKTGTQPPGKMEYHIIPHALPGHADCKTIRIIYNIPPGVQGPEHPNPGKSFTARGFPRHCYLPDSEKGRKVLKLLLVAWDRRLIFAIGTSSTTGESDTVIWNEIHHKTEFGSNLTGHGYPDINYLDNVLAELAAQGITEESLAQEKD
ncbi:hypothetical protein EK904_006876 [Melospiza melodia maxima]|nr:hypothetical protein EK904_006876 [Melospiza melodia maxima]